MRNHLLKLISMVVLSCTSSISSAAWFGDYVYAEKKDMVNFSGFLVPPPSWNIKMFDGRENYKQIPMAYCTDTTERRVPGKLVDGVCYVEWKGKEYGNEKFYLLKNPTFSDRVNYKLTQVTSSSKDFIIENGVTGGATDAGHYSYHCVIKIITNGQQTLGKYIPAHNRCYYGFHGGHYKHVDDYDAELYVPTAKVF